MTTMSESKCPFYMKATPKKPAQLNLKLLNPTRHMTHINYAEEFKKLDLDELKQDLFSLMKDSQEWWPADYGHYGPFFIRMAWHSAGTYRAYDGRGGANTGNQRFAPLNSWPDNGNLDKARRLLWPIKKKYGNKISWADLMIFAGNCAVESMGSKPFGFSGGRVDIWEPEEDVFWGPETVMLAQERYHGQDKRGAGDHDTLEDPLAAVQMGLIYVNPQGPGGNCDPLSAAKDIQVTFRRMGVNDEETVALIAGGHTFGKGHGAGDTKHVGPAPEDASLEEQGFGWKNSFGQGKGGDTITSGLEGAWTAKPAEWDHGYFENLFKYDWELTKTPAGASLWIPKNGEAKDMVPDAHSSDKKHPPVMFTTDLALKLSPIYADISKKFLDDPKVFEEAWAKAWYKLCHRDMGPASRCLGKYVAPEQLWQDPVPTSGTKLNEQEVAELKTEVLKSGLSISQLVRTAWASASTHRTSDFRGGANGARIRLAPQKDWAVNDPTELAIVLQKLEDVQSSAKVKVSLADLIVLGGCAAVEEASKKAGHPVSVPFTSGRTDASAEQTDAESFAWLEPRSDGFRNFKPNAFHLVDRAHLLGLSASEMVVLVGGLRVLNANTGGSSHGVLTAAPETLTNDFFVNLCDMSTAWQKSTEVKQGEVFEGVDRATGKTKWLASGVDLIFGSNSELRALSEFYAQDDSKDAFVKDFVAAWVKVMNLDRFDL